MKSKSRFSAARRVLIFWTLFIGIGAVCGAVGMISDSSGKALGMDGMLPYFKVLPFADILFNDLLFSGIALLIVNGITNITASVLLFMKKRAGIILGEIFGITLMLWICIQFYMFPPNFMSTIYFIFGFCQFVTGFAADVFYKQENFKVDTSQYKNIGKDKSKLVVYFSRMGYVKKLAYEKADETGADIYEIKSTEMTDGTLGFWWCGRFGMHRWDMPIEKIDINLESYSHVTICSPIWVFSLSAPIRAFCKEASGRIKEADYILSHHTNGKYENAAAEMDELLKITHTSYRSFRCRKGVFKEI